MSDFIDAIEGLPWGSPTPLTTFDRLKEKMRAMPPMPRAVIARFDVPMGRAFRMWDTSGHFVIYVHRGELLSEAIHCGHVTVAVPHGVALGIPLVYEP